MTSTVAPPEEPKIGDEERFYCPACEKTFATTNQNGLCLNCLSDKVIDRKPNEGD
jgi:hypothetical protein